MRTLLTSSARRVPLLAGLGRASHPVHPPRFHFPSSHAFANISRSFSSQNEDGENTHFGFKTVRAQDKAKMVEEIFSKVAERYDVMNDLMSGGMHRLWKDQLVSSLGPVRGTTMVDLAGGTGDVAFRILKELAAQRPPPL
eukprot:CAMPEP_0177746764 /NCGR_PEP_ID=MMETSP0484_2-20121128/31041_1 /TAXON_ID=354590 /ORGANISM="Rhodomonas lens, Strain RHODO" /LENGTH=139 /DNA_ID=CAMNT_0019261531 /DNA_START=60 /DNA_END=476 /DNA_ORIENTATION=-